MTEINTLNWCGVAMGRDRLVLLNPPQQSFSTEQALVLAAYLVALADPRDERFAAILEQVRSS